MRTSIHTYNLDTYTYIHTYIHTYIGVEGSPARCDPSEQRECVRGLRDGGREYRGRFAKAHFR